MTVQAHVVSHTHWDREWYLTREQFRLRLVDLIDRVLERLESEEGFLFHLDGQTIVLEDYLEVRPEAEERLRRHVASGRLLVGPWYVMPDQFLVSGEALVRNLALGHRLAERFGGVMAVGYIPDPFGHVAQMPQLLRGFGLDSAVLWRGLGPGKAERWWDAPDGSRVLLLHLPTEGYCNALRLPLLPADEMAAAGGEVVRREAERSTTAHVLLMAGVDHVEPHDGLDDLVRALDALPGVEARLSTLPAYVTAARQAVRAGDTLEVVRGELRAGQEHAFLLPGVLSARVYLKQANASAQRELEHWAEPLSTFAWHGGGADYPQGLLDYAWRTLLQNHPHDSICGCSVDAVHEENLTRYARAQQAAEGVSNRALRALASQVDSPPEGAVRCVLAWTDGVAFRGVVEAALDLPHEGAEREGLEVPYVFVPPAQHVESITAPDGRPVPFQVLGDEEMVVYAMSRFEPPAALPARRLRLLLDAEVPPCGYTTLDVRFGPPAVVTVDDAVATREISLENALVRADVNGDGTLDLLDKRSGLRYRRCLELEDGGDVGDEYTFCPPARDRLVTGGRVRTVRVIESGPLRAGLRVELALAVPSAAADDRRSRSAEPVEVPVTMDVRLAAGSPRVDVTLRVDNRAADHRLRVTLPTGTQRAPTVRADSAFALVERPPFAPPAPAGAKEDPAGTAPLLSLVDVGDEHGGMTLVADGLAEYEVLAGEEARLALTLLRCVGFLSRGDLATRRGHAGPGLPTPGAQCPGTHTFRFAFVPRSGPPAPAELFATARAFLSPPRLFAHAGGTGRLPRSLTFGAVAGDLVLSACKRADGNDTVVIRAFNPAPTEGRASVWLAPGATLHRLDLLERRQEALPAEDGRAPVTVAPHGIVTLELAPRR